MVPRAKVAWDAVKLTALTTFVVAVAIGTLLERLVADAEITCLAARSSVGSVSLRDIPARANAALALMGDACTMANMFANHIWTRQPLLTITID